MLSSTADVWASEPSTSSQQKAAEPVAGLTGQFDDFDPFKPDATAEQQRDGDEGRQRAEEEEEEALFKPRDITPQHQKQAELPAPPTPAKASSTTTRPGGATEASPASAMHDLGNAGTAAQHSHLHPQTPSKGKATTATTTGSQPMTPTSSGGLGNPLATIASAFRRRSVGASTPASRTQTPAPADKPAPQPAAPVLVLDKDETDAIDDSEKEAPQAIPSLGGGGGGGDDGSRDSFEGREGESAEDAVPFDFNLFLEQMRSRAAEPIGKYLRSFLKEFSKRTYGVNDQIRVINDFLDVRCSPFSAACGSADTRPLHQFIAVKMRENEVWKTASEREFDNAVEAMEKLVMNRVHHQ